MTKSLSHYITLSSDVVLQPVHDEAVLLDLASDQYIALNHLGLRIWQLLSENSSTEAAIAQLMQDYEVDEATLRQDMTDWIRELTERGLASVGQQVWPPFFGHWQGDTSPTFADV